MATHSSILVWKIPLTEEPGRLKSMGSQRVGHNWSDLGPVTCTHSFYFRMFDFLFSFLLYSVFMKKKILFFLPWLIPFIPVFCLRIFSPSLFMTLPECIFKPFLSAGFFSSGDKYAHASFTIKYLPSTLLHTPATASSISPIKFLKSCRFFCFNLHAI